MKKKFRRRATFLTFNLVSQEIKLLFCLKKNAEYYYLTGFVLTNVKKTKTSNISKKQQCFSFFLSCRVVDYLSCLVR